MKIYTPSQPLIPNYEDKFNLFLAGTIDNGNSIDWQSKAIDYCKKHQYADKIVIFNPRNSEWNSNIVQSDSDPEFRKQVDWELDCLEYVDIIFMHIYGNSISIISMLELGLFCTSRKMILAVEPDYFRRGNIEALARRNNIPLFDNFEDGLKRTVDDLFNIWRKE